MDFKQSGTYTTIRRPSAASNCLNSAFVYASDCLRLDLCSAPALYKLGFPRLRKAWKASCTIDHLVITTWHAIAKDRKEVSIIVFWLMSVNVCACCFCLQYVRGDPKPKSEFRSTSICVRLSTRSSYLRTSVCTCAH